MRETLGDWKRDWIEANGETSDMEVFIESDSHEEYIFKGAFKDIPDELLDKKVIKSSQIIASTVPERIGAYSLTILSDFYG